MKTYEATFKEENEGVFAISLVNDPATQETFIALSKQEEIKLAEVDKEQRIVMGLVLQPDQLIYRKQNGEEFNIVFRADTIKELSHNFFKSGFQLNSKLEHEESIEGVTFVESWLVENSAIDKSANFGFNYPKGSWIATMKIDNDDVWNNYVKTGKVQGFSVDAMVDLKEVNLKSNIEMAEEKVSFMDQLKVVLAEVGLVKKTEEVKLGSVQSGDITIEYDGESLEAGVALFVNQEGERVALPDGEYPSDMGVLVVADGALVEVKAEAPVEADAAPAAPAAPSPEDAVQAIKSLLIKYSEENELRFKTLEDSIELSKKENVELKAEVVTLSEQPAAKSIKTQVVQVELNKKGRLLESIRKNQN